MFYIANFWSLWYVWRCGYTIAHLKREGLGGAYISIMGVSFVGLGERVVQGVSALGGGGLTSGDVHVWLHALYAKAWGVHISVGGASFLGRGEGMSTLVGRINNFLKRLLKGSLAKSRDNFVWDTHLFVGWS